MANVLYGPTTPKQRQAHDEAVLEAQLHLLNLIKGETLASATRNYAEAYALISGLVSSPSTPVKQ